MGAGLLLLALVVGGVLAARGLWPGRQQGDDSATRPDPKAGAHDLIPRLPTPDRPVTTPGGSPSTPSTTPAVEPVPPRALPASIQSLAATYRQEVVRVNHPRNCVLCHAPSFQQADLIRGAVPDPKQPLPPPTTPAYYAAGGQFVAADTTYLRQDFSVVQPVPDSGNWSSHQRYDYFVAVRKVEAPDAAAPPPDSAYRRAVGFALRELSGRDPERDADWVAAQKRAARFTTEPRLAQVAQAVSLQSDPKAILALKAREFTQPLLSLAPDEIDTSVKGLQEVHGPAARTALVAYLEPLTRAGEAATRAKAVTLLRVVLGETADEDLPKALRLAAAAPAPVAPPVPDHGPIVANPATTTRGAITKRIDTRRAEELEKELLGVREVGLDAAPTTTAATELVQLAERRKKNGQAYPGSAVACEGRADLSGLPFRLGLDATLPLEKAQAMNGLSKELRQLMQRCIRNPNDPRPDTDTLRQMLTAEARRNRAFHVDGDKAWATAEAVPCIQQMLQAENREVRSLGCELLRRIDSPEATEALVRWAVFDTDPGNRAAAVAMLPARNRQEVMQSLVRYLRYPWPRAAEHAAEALVALDCREAIPVLAAYYDEPDPDAAFKLDLSTGFGRVIAPRPRPDPAPPALGPRPAVLAEVEKHSKDARDPDASVRRIAIAKLAGLLTDLDESVRLKAAESLAATGAEGEPAVAALKDSLTDSSDAVRVAARRSLEAVTAAVAERRVAALRAAVTPLIKELKAVEPEDRIKALDKLAALGADAEIAGEHVIEVMADKVPAVQVSAAEALAKISPKVQPHIVTLLRRQLRAEKPKTEAIEALAGLGAEAAIAVPLLIKCSNDPEAYGLWPVKGLPPDLFPALAKIAPKDPRFAGAVLAAIEAPNIRSTLFLRERRLAAIAQLDIIEARTTDKVRALVLALNDGQAAIEVITRLERYGSDAVDAVPALKKLKDSKDDAVRNAAIRAIAKIE